MASGFVLRTERLLLREWRPGDVEPMAAINRDPEVRRFLGPVTDPDVVLGFHARMLDHWARFGFGPFAVEGRSGDLDGVLLGFVGVAYPEFLPALAARAELGWRLASAAWGRGLATEAACAARDDAFARLAVPELIAIIDPGNVRSQRVATKLGMAREGAVVNPLLGREVDVWALAA